MKNTCPCYNVFQVLKVLLIKTFKILPPDLLLFRLAFTSDVILHKYLEIHSTLSEKKYFHHKFSFLTDSLKPSPPSPAAPNGQNPLSMTKVSSRCSLNYNTQ